MSGLRLGSIGRAWRAVRRLRDGGGEAEGSGGRGVTTMRVRPVLLCLAAAVAAIAFTSGASAGRSAEAPRVAGFSPPAVHAGGDVWIDAWFTGRNAPRVWLGGRRVPGRLVSVEPGRGDDAKRSLRVRVPRRLPAGSHEIVLATRAGAGAAAKKIVVASCTQAPAACGGNLNSGVSLTASGPGYTARLVQPGAATLVNSPSQSIMSIESGPVGLSLSIPVAPGDLRVGAVPVDRISIEDFTGGFRGYWDRTGGTVEVVEVSATRVRLCIDTVLFAAGSVQPAEVAVTGFLVLKR